MIYFLECSSDIDEFVETHPILEDYKIKVKNIGYGVNFYTIEINSIKVPEEVNYDTYRE